MKRILALVTLPLALAACSEEQVVHERLIEAQGRAIVEFMPNEANVSASFIERDADQNTASTRALVRANAAVDAIREIAGDGARISVSTNVTPFYEQVTLSNSDGPDRIQENRHPSAIIGYTAMATVNVTVTDIELAAQLRGVLMAAGPSGSGNIRFTLRPTVEHYQRAFEAAVQDAAVRAEIVADASDSRLDGIVTLQEGQGPCLGRASAPPAVAPNSGDRIVVTGSRIGRSELNSVSPIEVVAGEDFDSLVEQLVDLSEAFSIASDVQPQTLTAQVCAVFAAEAN
jgi:uncharacterized protein YggE